ncbi:hypothetical protein [Nocardia sp. NPDC019395]|uniref:WXG100 family type VII secretion target n=1 Tax=Nocardia sp. NPDC019395 TaxID=3154686 RepID=UPI0033EB9C07
MRDLPRTGIRGAHNRVDPDYAPTVEVFDNLTHEQIHAGVSLLNPSVLQTGGQLWQGAASGLNDAVTQAHTEIRGAIADGWRGTAAGLAAAAVRDFEIAGRQLADVLAAVAGRLGQAGDAAETLRAGIAEPSGTEPDLGAALLDPHAATGNIAAQRAVDDERADAVRVMESVYTGAFIPTGSQIPAFPDLPDPQSGHPGASDSPTTPGVTVPGSDKPVEQTVSFPAPNPVASPEGQQSPAGVAEDDPSRSGGPVPGGVPGPSAPGVPVPADQPQATTTAGTELPGPAPTAPAAVPSGGGTPVAPAAAPGVPVFSAPVRPAASTTDDDRKREEQQRGSSGEAITGMGAGAIGGMMGGAMAADTVRSGPPVAPARVDRTDDDGDELHFADEDLTFLEPADAGGQLIGALDPTTPPVLGEWTEAE